MDKKKISRALISVFNKDNLKPLVEILAKNKVEFICTGGTREFIENLGFKVTPVEQVTSYPSILGGRLKTLHPAIFGGILWRDDNPKDQIEVKDFNISTIDLVVVDLYPFEATVAQGKSESEIIEKIDIGGISLIRAAAKNFNQVLTVSSKSQYDEIIKLLFDKNCNSDLADRRRFATLAFSISYYYDIAIFNYFNQTQKLPYYPMGLKDGKNLRYGENPHQQGFFFGDLDTLFDQLNGRELSYNNFADVDAIINLVQEFKDETVFAIVKHTNSCGVATAPTVAQAYQKALEADPVSAFGGVLATNGIVNLTEAKLINELFFEILIAKDFTVEALALLKSKKNRIILKQKQSLERNKLIKTVLNGVIVQDSDWKTDEKIDIKVVTKRKPSDNEISALLFASKICKHSKSNSIVLATADRLLGSGVGQTSRVDALNQAISKAKSFNISMEGCAMASDAFFPFSDCVAIAQKNGIMNIIQPGGSVKDKDSIDYCDEHNMSMVFTGFRHFKH